MLHLECNLLSTSRNFLFFICTRLPRNKSKLICTIYRRLKKLAFQILSVAAINNTLKKYAKVNFPQENYLKIKRIGYFSTIKIYIKQGKRPDVIIIPFNPAYSKLWYISDFLNFRSILCILSRICRHYLALECFFNITFLTGKTCKKRTFCKFANYWLLPVSFQFFILNIFLSFFDH